MKTILKKILFSCILLLTLGLSLQGVHAEEINPYVYFNDVDNPSTIDEIKVHVNAIDDVDGNLTDDIYVVLDNYSGHEYTIGDFVIVFGVVDSANQETTIAITIRNVDITAPEIDFPNSNTTTISVALNSNIYEHLPIVTAIDGVDGDVSESIVITGLDLVDTSAFGEFTITYTVSDSFGNVATLDALVLVRDMVFPVIDGPNEIVKHKDYILNSDFYLRYFTASDDLDGVITNKISIVSNEYIGNANVPGSYDIVLKVSDEATNATFHTLTITVKETMIPYLIIDNYYWVVSADHFVTQNEFIDILKMIGDLPNNTFVFNTTYDTYSDSYRTSGYYEKTFNLLSSTGNEYDRVITLEVMPSNVNVINQDPSTFSKFVKMAAPWVPLLIIAGVVTVGIVKTRK